MKIRINNWSHYTITFAYIMAAVMFQFSILQIGDSYVYQYENSVTEGTRQDFKVSNVTKTESDELKKSFHQNFNEYQPTDLQTSCLIKKAVVDNAGNVTLCSGSQKGLKDVKDIEVKSGSFPQASNQVMINDVWNNHLSVPYKVHDTLRLKYMNGNKQKVMKVTVSGIYNSPAMQVDATLWGTASLIRSLPSKLYVNDFYFLSTASKKIPSFEDWMDKTDSVYDKVMGMPNIRGVTLTKKEQIKLQKILKQFKLNEQKMSLYYNNESVVNFGNVMKYIGIFIMIPMMLSLIALQRLQARLHFREYQILRCVGSNKRQQFFQVWKESLRNAVPAILLGLLLGTILNMLLGHYLMNTLLHLDNQFEIIYTWKTYALAVLVGLVPLLFSNTITLIKMRHRYPVHLMQLSHRRRTKNMKSYLDVLHFSNLSTVLIVIMFTIALFFYMIVVNTIFVLPDANVSMKEQISSYEVWANDIGTALSPTQINDLKNVNGVKAVYVGDSGISQMLNYQKTFIPHYVYGTALMQKFQAKTGMSKQTDVVYVLPKASKHKGKAITTLQAGQTYPFEVQGFNGKKQKKNIKIDKVIVSDVIGLNGIAKSHEHDPILIFSQQKAKEIFGRVSYTNALLDINKPVSQEQIHSISTILGSKLFEHGVYQEDEVASQTKALAIIVGFITFIITVTVLLCFYSILSFIMLAKRKELGILRAIGLPRKRVFTSMSLEVLYMLILSTILAFLAFYPAFTFLCNQAELAGSTMKSPSIINYIWTLSVGILTCMIVLIFMIRYQSKRQIILDITEGEDD